MCCQQSNRAIWLADDLLSRLHCLVHALEDGGQVSSLHLVAVHDETVKLLDEVGGFGQLVDQYRLEEGG